MRTGGFRQVKVRLQRLRTGGFRQVGYRERGQGRGNNRKIIRGHGVGCGDDRKTTTLA